jgi:hypothetical protein
MHTSCSFYNFDLIFSYKYIPRSLLSPFYDLRFRLYYNRFFLFKAEWSIENN